MKTPPSQDKKSVPGRAPIPGIRHLLVPLDFSGKSRQALKYAVPLARLCQARICLLHCLEPVYQPSEASGLLIYLGENISDQRRAAADRLARMARNLVPEPQRGRSLVAVGSAGEIILDTIRRQRIDLVVLSTRGRTGLPRLLLGSTAEQVVRRAPCPVLTVRRH